MRGRGNAEEGMVWRAWLRLVGWLEQVWRKGREGSGKEKEEERDDIGAG